MGRRRLQICDPPYVVYSHLMYHKLEKGSFIYRNRRVVYLIRPQAVLLFPYFIIAFILERTFNKYLLSDEPTNAFRYLPTVHWTISPHNWVCILVFMFVTIYVYVCMRMNNWIFIAAAWKPVQIKFPTSVHHYTRNKTKDTYVSWRRRNSSYTIPQSTMRLCAWEHKHFTPFYTNILHALLSLTCHRVRFGATQHTLLRFAAANKSCAAFHVERPSRSAIFRLRWPSPRARRYLGSPAAHSILAI